jgi:signal transduction histidine kinase
MRHLGRIIHRDPRRIALLGGIVLLPALALGLLAFRAFRGEQAREEYQRRERRLQILRLLENDLSRWILTRCRKVERGTLAFEVRENRILLPSLNVYISADYQRPTELRISDRDSNLWRDAQAAEFQGGQPTPAIQRYRHLLSGNPAVASWAKLALLRLALDRGASSDAEVWLKEIQNTDQAAVTESGIPIRVAAALLLIEHKDTASLPETPECLNSTLSQLISGSWPLNAAQWAYYARKICSSLNSGAEPCSKALSTAAFLEGFCGSVREIFELNRSLEWRRDRPFVARHLPGIQSVLILVPDKDHNIGCVLSSAALLHEAETRLIALTAAEDFEGRIEIAGSKANPAAASLAALPFLEASFRERDRTFWRSHLRRYSIFYATSLLLIGAGAGLFFTYRAVAREMEVSRMKAEFVSSVSHEFRTPLSAIEALLERLESGKVRDEEMLRRYYAASRREVQRLTAMVNQLLDFSRLKEGREQFSFETIDLNRLAEEVLQSFRDLGFGARLVDALDWKSLLKISADRDAIYQCIHNLIDNALKYSPDGSPVTIKSARQEGEALLRVSDRGPGIAPEERELIFEQFYRVSSTGVQNVQGAGIGLALVKRVMQAHGGKVTLESRTGEGSTFELTFPEKFGDSYLFSQGKR